MKKYIKSSILVLLVTLMFVSCNKDLLDPVPKTSIDLLTSFETRDRIVGQVNGMYGAFKDGRYLGGRYINYNDIRSDDFLNLQNNGVTNLAVWNFNLTNSTNEVQNLWDAVYNGINRVNMFLEGMETNKANILAKGLLTETEWKQFKGEALALRGMAYFHLSMLYARPHKQNPAGLGMILRLVAERTPANNGMARSTIAQTYEQILKDFNDAEPLLPAVTGANSVLRVTRFHKSSVIAFKTRVYLHLENWDKVIEEANKIVSTAAPFVAPATQVSYALSATFPAIFNTPFTTAESILSMPMTATELPGTQNGVVFYFAPTSVSGGANEYCINLSSVVWTSTEFPATDARRVLTTDFTVGGTPRKFIAKYKALTDFVPVMRYAEVLLNLAEAEARKNGVAGRALALLNAIYLRSNPTATAYTAANFATVDAFVNRLMLERNMEFMGEGIRNMDVTRKLAPFAAKGTVAAVPITSIAYTWPIPQSEFNTNPLVVGNP